MGLASRISSSTRSSSRAATAAYGRKSSSSGVTAAGADHEDLQVPRGEEAHQGCQERVAAKQKSVHALRVGAQSRNHRRGVVHGARVRRRVHQRPARAVREVHRGPGEGHAGPGVRLCEEDEAVARGARKRGGAADREHARVRRQGGSVRRARERGRGTRTTRRGTGTWGTTRGTTGTARR